MNAKSRHLLPGSAEQSSRMNVEPSKARKTKGGENHVGFVRDVLTLGRKPDFLGCVRDRAEDDQWGVDARYQGRVG